MEYPSLEGWCLEKKRRTPEKKRRRGRPRKRKTKARRGAPRKKRKFEETPVGFLISREAPLEYGLIRETHLNAAPEPDFIEAIGYSSLNPLFRKLKFRKALKHYRENGLYCGDPKRPNPTTELYYMRIRRNNL